MIPRNREHVTFALLLVALLALSLCDGRLACAQDVTDTDPIVLEHPTTGEKGTWIPDWLKREHLLTEAQLQSCTEQTSKQDQELGARKVELQHRTAALEQSKQAEKALQTSLAHTKVRLQETEEDSETKSDWLIVTTTTSVVATVLAIVIAAL